MIKDRYPAVPDRLQELAFPENIHSFAVFMQIMEAHVCKGQQVIWIFDDYGVIESQQIKNFIRTLIDANFDNFHLVLLSNELNSAEPVAFMATRRALILADELRFNKNEIRELPLTKGTQVMICLGLKMPVGPSLALSPTMGFNGGIVMQIT